MTQMKQYRNHKYILDNHVNEVIGLYTVDGLSMEKIAEHFHVSITAVRNLLIFTNTNIKPRSWYSGEKAYWYGKPAHPNVLPNLMTPKGVHRSPSTEFKKGHQNKLAGIPMSDEHKKVLSEARKRFFQNPENREKQSQRMKGKQLRLGKHHSLEAKAKMSRASRSHWQNPEYRLKTTSAIMKGLNIRPNKEEERLRLILDKHYPNQWKYVGDGQVNIGGRFPDFINVNGKKQLIEMFGKQWHGLFDVGQTVEHYRVYGFQVAIIWEDELKDENRLVKVLKRKFQNSEVV